MVRVVIVDDQALVRAGFEMILGAERDLEVVGTAGNGREAIEMVRATAPDVVLMDIRMPEVDGLQATRQLMADGNAPRILILTTFDLDEYVYEALRAGASGFLLKEAPPESLIAAVHAVATGETLLAPSVTRRLIERYVAGAAPRDPVELEGVLTSRELDVLRLIARALSNSEIAEELVVSEATVKTHVTRILMKLGLRDRVQAVVFAYEHGLVRPDGGSTRGSRAT